MGRIDIDDGRERLEEFRDANRMFPRAGSFDEPGAVPAAPPGPPTGTAEAANSALAHAYGTQQVHFAANWDDGAPNPIQAAYDPRGPRSPVAPAILGATGFAGKCGFYALWSLFWLLMVPAALVAGVTVVLYQRSAPPLFRDAFREISDGIGTVTGDSP